MWRLLVLNGILFFTLFFVPIYSPARPLKFLFFSALLVVSIFTALKTPADPYTVLYYLVFCALALWTAPRWRQRVLSPSLRLEEEVGAAAADLDAVQGVLRQKNTETHALESRASEIAHLYEKIKEMSRSLDVLEVFLIFGEALSKHFQFEVMKLAIFAEENPQPHYPDEVYELRRPSFEGNFEKSVYLKDKNKTKTAFFPFDQKISDVIFKDKKTLSVLEPSQASDDNLRLWPDFSPFLAIPILVEEKVRAILILYGVDRREFPMLTILTERFVSEARRVKLYEKIETLAITDGLTGVFVRRYLLERLEGEVARARRFAFKLSFLMIDIDHFKRFNDEHGHLVGDVVLREVAQTIKKNIREIDLVGRYGGEEFGVILIETDETDALHVAERIRRAVNERSFTAYDEDLKVTISIGCSSLSTRLGELTLLLEAADSALYRAKEQGRNRVCLSALGD